MVGAACLLFFSQFFNYADRNFGRPLTDNHLIFHGGYLEKAETGWEMHSWYTGIVFMTIAYLFYANHRSLPYYIVSVLIMLPLALGNGTGAVMGIISVALAAYAIYLKSKENKMVNTKPV